MISYLARTRTSFSSMAARRTSVVQTRSHVLLKREGFERVVIPLEIDNRLRESGRTLRPLRKEPLHRNIIPARAAPINRARATIRRHLSHMPFRSSLRRCCNGLTHGRSIALSCPSSRPASPHNRTPIRLFRPRMMAKSSRCF